jgi:hypothetical protein
LAPKRRPYSAAAAGGAKMTRPILAGGPFEAADPSIAATMGRRS